MDLGVRLGVLLGFARWRRRLVPSLDFDHFCCVRRFWQLGRAPELGKSQKSQNQKILYAPLGEKTASEFVPPKESFVSRAAAGSLDSERERSAQGVGPRNTLEECIWHLTGHLSRKKFCSVLRSFLSEPPVERSVCEFSSDSQDRRAGSFPLWILIILATWSSFSEFLRVS